LPITINSGISIQPGFKTYVGINRQVTNKLADPYSKCLSDLTPPNTYAKFLFGYFSELNVTYYDQNFCFKLCYQDKLINKCKCADISTPSIRNATFCADNTEIECLEQFDSNFTISDINSVCDNACPQQCKSVDYNLVISTSAFPALNYLKILHTSTRYATMFPYSITDSELMEFAREGILKLVVNYDSSYDTLITESPAMDGNSLFGFLGGQLGILKIFDII
jgi:hypothetical protein